MTAVIPEMDPTRPAQRRSARRSSRRSTHFGVTNLFGSPALIQRVGRYGVEHGVKLPSLRRVISAGAPVPAVGPRALPVAAGRRRAGPHALRRDRGAAGLLDRQRRNPRRDAAADGARAAASASAGRWRACASRSSASATSRSRPGATTCDVPPGEIGEIVVQGPVVTRSYFNRPESTALAKIADPARRLLASHGRPRLLDEQGRLWFCGRKSQRVVTPERTLFTIPCEGVFNAHPAVYRTALVGVARNGATEPVLCVEPEKDVHDPATRRCGRSCWRWARPGRTRRRSRRSCFTELPGGHPAQREDLPREAGGLGGEATVMNALVTGGGGFLGGAIVRRLVGRGDRVRSLSRGHYPELDALGVEQIQGDVADAGAVDAAVAGCDVVFHVAAKAGVWGRYADYYRANVVGTQNVLAACRKHGVRRLVYTSSPSVVFDGRDMEGVDESVPYPDALRGGLSADQGGGRAAGAGGERPRPGDGGAAAAPDLGAGRQPPDAAHPGARPRRPAAPHRPGEQAHRHASTSTTPPTPTCWPPTGWRPARRSPARRISSRNGEPMPLWDLVNRILAAGGVAAGDADACRCGWRTRPAGCWRRCTRCCGGATSRR